MNSKEVIQLEDTDEEGHPEEKGSVRQRQESSAKSLQDEHQLLEYNNVPVYLTDLKTLQYDTWLNDTIIDFYLNYLQQEILPQEDREGVYVFSSMFYIKLTGADLKGKSEAGGTQERLTASERRHLEVKTWTKTFDIFEKNLLIFPICKHSHWFLIVVVKPGLVASPKERNNNGEPLIILLDSLGEGQSTAVRFIREYLEEEWRTKKSAACGGQAFKFSSKEMKTIKPKKVILVSW